MASISNRIEICNEKLFREKIIDIVDMTFNQRYWYVNCHDSKEFDAILRSIVTNYDSQVDSDQEDDTGTDEGSCVPLTINKKVVLAFWFKKNDINAMVHETLHAVLRCAQNRGITIDAEKEAICYMLGFLVENLTTALSLELRPKRRKS